MIYNNLEEFSVSNIDDFNQIFIDNWINSNNNSITEEKWKFLEWKTIIFEETFFWVSLYYEPVKDIFNNENIIKIVNKDNIFYSISNWNLKETYSNIKFKNESISLNWNVKFKDCNFNNLSISSTNWNSNIIIEKWNINGELDLSSIQNINNISLSLIEKIDSLTITNLMNINSFNINVNKVKNLNIEHSFFEWKQFSINNTNIINTTFNHVNFWEMQFNWVNFTKLSFYNTTFNNCTFNNTNFPKKLENNILWVINISNKEQKDNYRQLKHVMDKNANYTEANDFFSREMTKHYQSLKWYDINKVILLIQWVISYYWNSWLLAIMWIILFWINTSLLSWDAYFYYNISLLSHNNIDFYNLFFTNINPFNKSLLTEKWITYWLFFHKIVLIILYYHLIIALKRTTRR